MLWAIVAVERYATASVATCGAKRLRRHAHSYRYWRPPGRSRYAAWPLARQIAATRGLTVLTQASMAMWGILRDLGLEADSSVMLSTSRAHRRDARTCQCRLMFFS